MATTTTNTRPPSPTTTSSSYTPPQQQQTIELSSPPRVPTYSVQQLQAIMSRLDLLKAGSLLLLPSVLPYLASALTALTTASLIEPSTAEEGKRYWWVAPLLPCIGLVLPMVIAKVLDARDKRKNGGGCCRMKRRGDYSSTTTCPYARVMNRLSLSRCSSKEDPHLLPVEALSPQLFNENSSPPKQQTRRGLRRPRTLMLTSLCLWSVLLASAPRLGLNKTVSFTVYSSLGGAALDDIMLTTVPTPCSMSSAVAPVAPAVPPMTENTYSEGLTSTAWSDISEAAMDARVLSAEEDEVMESEWRLALPEETLDSMTAQQRESLSALRDFWDAMEVVVGDPYEAEEIQEEFEEQLSEQLELEYDEDREEASTTAATITQEELIQGMEEKMMDARDQIAGDDEETREVRVFQYVPVWTEVMLFAISFAVGGVVVALAQARAQTLEFLQLASAQQKRFGDEDDDEINESSSDIDADTDSEREDSASLSEKGAYQLLPSSSTKNKNKPTVIPTAFNRMLLLLALATNFWVVHCEYWDLPAFIFVGLGSTALLVHTWIIRDL